MKSSSVEIGRTQFRWVGMILSVLIVVSSYAWGQDAKPAATQMADLVVNVGEAVRVEVTEATQVAIAEPSIADAVITSKKEILVNGKKAGVTTLNVWETSGALKTYRVVVSEGEYPSKAIREAINLPDVHVRVIGNAVILEGTVADDRELERAVSVAGAYREKVVNLLEVLNPVQVRIKIQVADVRLSNVENKGLEYPDSVSYTMDIAGENTLSGTPLLGQGNPFFTVLHGLSSTSSGITPNAPNTIDAGMFAQLDMLERNGNIKILAEPTLVTLSGKEASFLAGGEFPVVIALQNSFSVEFKEFGVKMKIKPVVDSRENINAAISAELSAIDPTLSVSSSTAGGGINIPGLTSRKATTSLQLKNGQTVMIGGLLDRETTEGLRRVPWIGKVPILGLFFTAKSKDREDRELIFFATFDLVRNPTAEAAAFPVGKEMKDLMNEPKMKAGEDDWQNAQGKGK